MFKRLDVENFESHKHTVVEFGDGVNLLIGASNSGKTSIIRAMKLVCYNEFTPASVSVGQSHCVVTLTTDKGVVSVKRGKKVNEWTVCKHGDKPVQFLKPGKDIIPEAAEITGVHTIKLGDREVSPNIMNQLEGHFLLAELSGKSVSGSYRAQMIDEISGLEGIEEIVKSIGLDRTRLVRDTNATEKQIRELEDELYDKKELANEKKRIDTISGLFDTHDSIQSVLLDMQEMLEKHDEILVSTEEIQSQITDCDAVLLHEGRLFKAERQLATLVEIKGVFDRFEALSSSLESVESQLASFPNMKTLVKSISLVEKESCKLQEMLEVVSRVDTLKEVLSEKQSSLVVVDDEISITEKELKDRFGEIEVCPICGKPIHEGCDAYEYGNRGKNCVD